MRSNCQVSWCRWPWKTGQIREGWRQMWVVEQSALSLAIYVPEWAPPVIDPWGFSCPSDIPNTIFSLLLNVQQKGFPNIPIIMTGKWADCYSMLLTLSVKRSVRLDYYAPAIHILCASYNYSMRPHIQSFLCSFRTFFVITTGSYDCSTSNVPESIRKDAHSAHPASEKDDLQQDRIFLQEMQRPLLFGAADKRRWKDIRTKYHRLGSICRAAGAFWPFHKPW